MFGVRRLSLWCLTVLCAASGSCSDGNSPSGVIIFEAGNQQADTAYAELTQALRVRIFGAPSGTIVRFQSLPVDTGPPRSSVYVAAPSAPFYDFLADSTDQTGETSARIKLGTVAGQGRLQVSVPELDLVDTATFTILPGRAARVLAIPADTALYAAGTFQGRAVTTDQWGNVRADDPVVYSDGSTGITVSANGLITATAIGRSSYVARAGHYPRHRLRECRSSWDDCGCSSHRCICDLRDHDVAVGWVRSHRADTCDAWLTRRSESALVSGWESNRVFGD